jgi:hypothetical protein
VSVNVRAHRRRWPRSAERTGFDWRAATLVYSKRMQLAGAENRGDIGSAARLRRELAELERKGSR